MTLHVTMPAHKRIAAPTPKRSALSKMLRGVELPKARVSAVRVSKTVTLRCARERPGMFVLEADEISGAEVLLEHGDLGRLISACIILMEEYEEGEDNGGR